MMPAGENGCVKREWHKTHVLASHAPMERRIEWHLEHVRECGCAPVPPSVLAEIRARGIDVPGPEAGPE